MPHPSIVRKWFQRIDGGPGFTKQSFTALEAKVKEAVKNDKKIICTLILDEISIRREVEGKGNVYSGYIDYGTNLDDDELPFATQSLTFFSKLH